MARPIGDDLSLGPLVPELVLIPGGTFTMGRDDRRNDEAPAHVVTIGPFYAAVSPVTNAEYERFVAATGHPAPRFFDDGRFNAPAQPVVGVSWDDAVAYCAWLSGHTGRRYRLPTEAEREFAALGGLAGVDWPWETGQGARHPLEEVIANADRPHPPGPGCANGYGLRCMAENVHEWCSDWYDPAYYARSPVASPGGPARGARKSSRGGSWRHSVKFTRITARASLAPDRRYNDFGFRVYANA
ncbi:MAG: formylglycine-generating enzyme family protein [Dehalococcoidia bacterium]